MDKKYKQIFVESFFEQVGLDSAENTPEKLEVEGVANSNLDSLTSLRSGYFSLEDTEIIVRKAGQKMAQVYINQSTKDLRQAWTEIVQDFHSNGYWGFNTQSAKPKPVKKKNEIAGFLWTVFQAAVVMKLIVLYFGINAAELDSDAHYVGLGIAIFISFASLLYFAYRKSKTYKD